MPKPIPDAYLLLAPGCTYCPSVLEGLSQLIKAGKLGKLEIVNIHAHPEAAEQVSVRSVPWCRIGPFELDGAQSPSALTDWTRHATEGTGLDLYFRHLLETQRPHAVTHIIQSDPASLSELLVLLEDTNLPMSVRIGIGVVLEDLHGDPVLLHGQPSLLRLARSNEANIRADSAHYLSLIHSDEAVALLQDLLQDEHPDVREIAAESLDRLNAQYSQT
ncbi:MAG: HEAT repeat domain-containing protein [Gammaproteobacteria bacterium]|nr:HEAT repeat domain-containing protein [Gammaproteobacteria bacterium]